MTLAGLYCDMESRNIEEKVRFGSIFYLNVAIFILADFESKSKSKANLSVVSC